MKLLAHLVLVAMLAGAAAGAARGQLTSTEPTGQQPVTPKELIRRLEATAAKVRAMGAHADRIAVFDMAWPVDAAEYQAVGRSVIVLVGVVTSDRKELPVRRVYLRVDGKDVELKKLGSRQGKIDARSPIRATVGANREDGFYLAPAALLMRHGAMLADFAANRKEFSVAALPADPPAYARADPGETTPPDRAALRAMFGREFSGFALPAELR